MTSAPDRETRPGSPRRPQALPRIRRPVLYFFRHIVHRYLRRHFRAVRVVADSVPKNLTGLLIVYGNHSSWWDPMVLVLLAEQLWPERRHYAPMDETALTRYPILRRIGIFPIAPDSPRGAAQFLRTAQAILASGGVLWITPQGRFVDASVRPLGFRPGLAALAARSQPVTLLPLAIEYTFWDERLPELLIRFGEPIFLAANAALGQTNKMPAELPTDWTATTSVFRHHPERSEGPPHFSPTALEGVDAFANGDDDLNTTLETALATTMDDLRIAAIARSPAPFRTLITGARGTGGAYSLIQRLKAALTGRPYQPDHTAERE